MDTVTLHTTQDQFEDLHARQARARSTSTTITVDRAALINLLMDHSQLVHAAQRNGVVIPNAYPTTEK